MRLYEQVVELWNAGKTKGQIAKILDLTTDVVHGMLNYARRKGMLTIVKNPYDPFGEPLYLPPKLIGFLKVDYTDVIITSDWHIPYIDEELLDELWRVQKKTKIKTLVIAGDFMDLPQWSFFEDKKDHKRQFNRDKNVARRIMYMLADKFDKIYLLTGNHDKRWIKQLEYDVDMEDLYAMLIKQDVKKTPYNVSDYGYMLLGNWRITHPKNYSIFFGKIGRDLAEKFHNNICYAHGHQMGITFDRSSDYIVVATGAMVDQQKIDYSSLIDTTHPKWETGFVVLKDKMPFLVSKRVCQI